MEYLVGGLVGAKVSGGWVAVRVAIVAVSFKLRVRLGSLSIAR
jgi:hypothetical protein